MIHARCSVAGVVAVFGFWAASMPAVGNGQQANAEAPSTGVDFNREVAPILVRRCLECHNGKDRAGGLELAQRETAFSGGDSGAAIVVGRPDDSPLLARVLAEEMPPARQGQPQPLPEKERDTLRKWIAAGAEWPPGRVLDLYESTSDVRAGRDWWALQPVVRPEIPSPEGDGGLSNPIDAFVIARLEQAAMTMAPPAERATLARRLYFDLWGLPPTAEEIEAFVSDPSPTAYESLVDRLLGSPHFGERWARHWLDAVRYADTSGYERDQEKPHAWRFRDWVVQAISHDMPYNRFVAEQLAGDELPDRNEASVIATGMLRLGTWNDEPNDPEEYKYERLEDLVHVVGSAFLGMTVKCSRCHDHKFDPIPQVDYYRLAGAFWPGPIEPRQRELLGGPSREELGYDVLGWTDVRSPPPLHLLKKGDPAHPGDEVAFAPLSFAPAAANAYSQTGQLATNTSGRRRQLAAWIVDPRNPLTARVIVNRLWMHHFGQGLVRSVNNFGFTGDKPSHPELLDWLAAELVDPRQPDASWSLKRIHRLILLSGAYRQSAVHPLEKEYRQRDFDNRLLWRANRRRKDAESLRDSMLAVSGQLDTRLGGPGFRPTVSAEALEGLSRKASAWQASPLQEQRRRSLYMFSQRSLIAPFLTTFDFCDTTQPCEGRQVSTVAPQALALLNNPFVHDQSQELADRVLAQSGACVQDKVLTAWRLAWGRPPTSAESEAAAAHLAAQERRFSQAMEPPSDRLALHLAADRGLTLDQEGRLAGWQDQSGNQHDAAQSDAASRPQVIQQGQGTPVIRFNGQGAYLKVAGQVLNSQQFTVIAVASDRADSSPEPGHREIFSNWSGRDGNAGTSVFLGLTREAAVRWSDDFTPAGSIAKTGGLFILSAVAGESDAAVYFNARELGRKGAALSPRVLSTPYVIGQQGNIDGEYWNGDLAELLVYDRALPPAELAAVWSALGRRHALALDAARFTPQFLALASLCHVLLNANEFAYVD